MIALLIDNKLVRLTNFEETVDRMGVTSCIFTCVPRPYIINVIEDELKHNATLYAEIRKSDESYNDQTDYYGIYFEVIEVTTEKNDFPRIKVLFKTANAYKRRVPEILHESFQRDDDNPLMYEQCKEFLDKHKNRIDSYNI